MPAFSRHLISRVRGLVDTRWRGRGLVLLYHRVARLDADPQRLAVTPEVFEEHLGAIKREANPLPLDELVQRAKSGSLPPRSVAITFDDGYADVLHEALPRLAASRIPATVFVTSEAVSTGRFWWDAISRLLHAPSLPGRIDLTIDRDRVCYEFDDADRREVCEAAWHVERDAATSRQRAYRDLCARLKTRPREVRVNVINQLTDMIGESSTVADRPLTPDEVSHLAQRGMTVGSHTHAHCSLGSLDADAQLREIAAGRAEVEQWIGRPSTVFAYPFGGASDISNDAMAAARRAGITVACSGESGRVGSNTNPWRVPRVTMRDWSGDAFRSRWNAWLATS